MAKRHWSTEFTPHGNTERNHHISIGRVPANLREAFRKACRQRGISQRNLILRWVRNYVEGRRPDEDAPKPQ